MGFFDLFKKWNKKQNEQKDSVDEPIDRLDEDGELPLGWVYANRDFTEQIQNEYRHLLNAQIESIHKNDIKNEYSATKSLILYIQDTEKLCAKKGECFTKWFNDYVVGDNFLSKKVERLNYISENIDTLLKEQALIIEREKLEKEYESTIEKDLLEIIKDKPGILQKDIYKKFDPLLKSLISSTLYFMSVDGKIKRIKSGNTYSLYKQKEGLV